MTFYEDLKGKTIIVNGGTKGIGLEIVREFLKNESRVVLTGRTKLDDFKQIGELTQEYGIDNVTYYVVDSSRSIEIEKFIENIASNIGEVHVLVNNAAINHYSDFLEVENELLAKIINTNLVGYFSFIRGVVPLMPQTNKNSIINISSTLAERVLKGRAIYASTKAAINSITRSAAIEFANRNIRVNSLCVGTVLTDMVRKTLNQSGNPEAEKIRLISRIPLGRFGTPREIANVVKFLASENSSFITGESVFVDGGFNAGFTD